MSDQVLGLIWVLLLIASILMTVAQMFEGSGQDLDAICYEYTGACGK